MHMRRPHAQIPPPHAHALRAGMRPQPRIITWADPATDSVTAGYARADVCVQGLADRQGCE